LPTFRVSVEEQLGLQLVDENEAVVPDGSPETLKEMACDAPESKLAVSELLIEAPAVTDLLPELAREKSNG
jgi:hypothetical protein